MDSLITKSDPSGTWWLGVGDDKGGRGKWDLCKRVGMGFGLDYMISVLVECEKEAEGGRQTSPDIKRQR